MDKRYLRIGQNAMFLYLRMIVVMGVSFFTVRMILDILGVEDYGIYYVITGFITLISVLNGTLAAGTQRFLTFEIGKNDADKLKITFSSSLLIHISLAALIFILGQTVGLWFLFEKASIPEERTNAAFWTYQFSLLTMLVSVTQIPYNAIIIAHERMKLFAYISLLEAFFKLCIVYLLSAVSYDKLIFYSFLMFICSTFIALIYRGFAYKNYKETHFKLVIDKEILMPLLKFSSWNFFGTLGFLLSNQGIVILLNLFFGPIANAALAIAMQVNMVINQFINSFQQAMTPTITKLYASDNTTELKRFLNQNVKYAFFLIWLIVLPISLYLEFILDLWLIDVPQYTIIFTQLLIIYALQFGMIRPLVLAIQATGKLKGIQLTVGGLLIFNFLISCLVLELGYSVYSPIIILILTWSLHLFLELFFLKKYIDFSYRAFFVEAVLPIFIIVIISFCLIYPLSLYLRQDLLQITLCFLCSLVINLILIYFIGVTKEQKTKLKIFISNRFISNK